jgi:hypothetical protein
MKKLFQPNIGKTGRILRGLIGVTLLGSAVAAWQVQWLAGVGLAAPMALALLINREPYREAAVWLSLILGLWILRCLRASFWTLQPNVPQTVSGLLAGIVFVDWLSVAPAAPRELSLIFLGLFAGAWLAQRLVPAT